MKISLSRPRAVGQVERQAGGRGVGMKCLEGYLKAGGWQTSAVGRRHAMISSMCARCWLASPAAHHGAHMHEALFAHRLFAHSRPSFLSLRARVTHLRCVASRAARGVTYRYDGSIARWRAGQIAAAHRAKPPLIHAEESPHARLARTLATCTYTPRVKPRIAHHACAAALCAPLHQRHGTSRCTPPRVKNRLLTRAVTALLLVHCRAKRAA